MAKKMSDLERQYKKELTRIKKYVKGKAEKGFITELYKIPETPTNITQEDVERIKNIKAKDIRKQFGFADTQTGEFIEGYKALEYRRKVYDKDTSYIIIDRVRELLRSYSPAIYWSASFAEMKQHYVDMMSGIFESELNNIGVHQMSIHLQNKATELNTVMDIVMYHSDYYETIFNYNLFLEIVLSRDITLEERMFYEDYYGEYMETNPDIV